MAKIFIKTIESSSKANCINLDDKKTNIFLDFGTEYSNIENFYIKNKIKKEMTKACLITHAHIDHIKSVYKNKNKSITFYCTKETKNHINLLNPTLNNKNCFIIKENKWIKIKNTNWKIKAIKTIHNISGSVCFIIKNKNKKILYITDTEYFNNKNFRNMNAYIIESNYGADDTINTTKFDKHILKNEFHMNIYESIKLSKENIGYKTKLVLFSHLSSKNKTNYIDNILVKLNKNKKIKFNYINPSILFDKEFTI